MTTSSSEGKSTGKRVKVLLADDHAMFREGFAGMLASSYGDEVVAMPQESLELAEDGLSKDGAGSVLSRNELEILLLAARGMSNHQIASRPGIAEATVKRHMANVYPKMGVSSRGEAVRVALENEWFTIREIEAAIDGEKPPNKPRNLARSSSATHDDRGGTHSSSGGSPCSSNSTAARSGVGTSCIQ